MFSSQSRHASEQRSPSQPTSVASNNQQLLPPPTAIAPPTSNPSIQSSPHSQQAALLASQILASSGVYTQDLLSSGLLPYSHYYGSMPGASFYLDPRLMHELNAVANNDQIKNLHANRHRTHASTHSPPDPSVYSNQSKRHPLENIGKKMSNIVFFLL